MSTGDTRHTIVEYYAEQGHSCGYCHSSNTSFSHGLWAHSMKVEDYQALIDRGWRRSGQYCYKPIMDVTCCPMYTIRCAAKDFTLSRSQKKILKKVHHYLAYGTKVAAKHGRSTEAVRSMDMVDVRPSSLTQMEVTGVDCSGVSAAAAAPPAEDEVDDSGAQEPPVAKMAVTENTEISPGGEGRPKRGKAKMLRMERKRHKLRQQGLTEDQVAVRMVEKKRMPVKKTVEDLIQQPMPDSPAHELEVRLVRSCPPSPDFEATFEASYELYKKYQMSVHKDPPEKVTPRQFQRFLVLSPLQIQLVDVKSRDFESTFPESAALFAKYQRAIHREAEQDCSPAVFTNFLVDTPLEDEFWGVPIVVCLQGTKGYGSYHQQYWLDKKLIAVGVVDLLPSCLSSVYFYYDPELSFLSLGTYGALREVAFTRSLTGKQFPRLLFYYMGFYIHSCVKMRYKAALQPSYLLCPEATTWQPVARCLAKLDAAKYSRLDEQPEARDGDSDVVLADVLVLYKRVAMSFTAYSKRKKCDSSEKKQILEYGRLVGCQCARRMLLYRM